MAWLEIAVRVDHDHVDLLSEVLTAQGALAVTFSAQDQQEIFQEEVGETRYWNKTQLRALFSENEDPEAIIRQVCSSLPVFNALSFDSTIVEDQDWVRLTQQQFQPVLIDERLWVVPSWMEMDDQRLQIKLDPGLAFGTGTHPTTQLCLSWLVQSAVNGETVVDYGCGSGVLSLAALGLGAKKVYAIDHDQQALEATVNNAQLNRCKVGEAIVPLLDDDVPFIQVPVVLANILAKPLCTLVETFHALLLPGGVVVLSGIQRADIAKIREHYQERFEEKELVYQDEWARMVWVKLEA